MISSEVIIDYLARNGPTFGPELMEGCGLNASYVTKRTDPLLARRLIECDKACRPGSTRLVNRYRLAGTPVPRASDPEPEEPPSPGPAPRWNPSDPFGLYAKLQALRKERASDVSLNDGPCRP